MSIESIRARALSATPGPWEVPPSGRPPDGWFDVVTGDDSKQVACDATLPDADFIAHSRTDIDLLLAVAEAAKEYAASWGVGPDCDISRASIGDWRVRCERARSAMFAALDALEAPP